MSAKRRRAITTRVTPSSPLDKFDILSLFRRFLLFCDPTKESHLSHHDEVSIFLQPEIAIADEEHLFQ